MVECLAQPCRQLRAWYCLTLSEEWMSGIEGRCALGQGGGALWLVCKMNLKNKI